MSNLPIAIPYLGEEEIALVSETIRSGWIMQGPRVAEFERLFCNYTRASFAKAVTSCTSGLFLALRAAGVGFGDTVITSSHSFIATANAIRMCGAEPVFVDIDPLTLNLNPDLVRTCLETDFDNINGVLRYRDVVRLKRCKESPLNACNERAGKLSAILIVHQVGVPADLRAFLNISRDFNIPLVEDAACALGSEITLDDGKSWEKIGKPHGIASVFSFHPRKVLTTGEGGMVTVSESGLDERIRLWREHGLTVSTFDRDSSSALPTESFVTTSFNYRMTDLQGALGVVQMGRLSEILNARNEIATHYSALISQIDGVQIPYSPIYAKVNHQSYVVKLENPGLRPALMTHLKEKGIATRPGITSVHQHAPYQDAWPSGCLQESEAASANRMILPLFHGMEKTDVERVVSALSDGLTALD